MIGVDNDEIICNLCHPNLTSVDVNTYNVGYEAAALLDRMIAGEPAPEQPLLLAPRRGRASRIHRCPGDGGPRTGRRDS